jgi:hypothetical protein
LTDQARINHRYMLCLATIVIAETRHLTLAMDDDSFSRRLSGKEWRFRPRQSAQHRRGCTGQFDELPPAHIRAGIPI